MSITTSPTGRSISLRPTNKSKFILVFGLTKVLKQVQNKVDSTTQVCVILKKIHLWCKFASSKILLWFQCGTEQNGTINGLGIKLYRGSTVVKENGQYSYPSTSGWNAGIAGFNYLYMDSPNTTSATTYKLSQNQEANGVIYWNYGSATNGMTVIAQEISG